MFDLPTPEKFTHCRRCGKRMYSDGDRAALRHWQKENLPIHHQCTREMWITCYVCGKPMAEGRAAQPQGEAAHYDCIRDYRCRVCRVELPHWPLGERPHFTQSGRPRNGTLLCEQHKHYRWCTCINCGNRFFAPNRIYCDDCSPAPRRPSPVRTVRAKPDTPYEPIDPKVVFERDKWICGECHKPINKTLKFPDPKSASVDHVIPLAHGGADTYSNVRATHLRCNLKKASKLQVC